MVGNEYWLPFDSSAALSSARQCFEWRNQKGLSLHTVTSSGSAPCLATRRANARSNGNCLDAALQDHPREADLPGAQKFPEKQVKHFVK